ncbi:TPM domain-containing protein [bacterium]|nr:TPM domain-containing protein [bacterium]
MKGKNLLLLCVTVAAALNGQQRDYPAYRGFVNDFVGVIETEYERRITALAQELEEKTGAQIAVVTVRSLGDESPETYAVELFAAWGIGRRGVDDGLLILFDAGGRQVRMEVGDGLEGIITDGTAGAILDRYSLPDFRNGEYGRGLYRAAAAVAGIIARDSGVEISGSLMPARDSTDSSRSRQGGGGAFFVIIVILIILTRGRIIPWLLLGSMMGGGRSGGGFGGGGFGGGFGGFGGGMSSGGGATRSF